jgi:hypothetical protein
MTNKTQSFHQYKGWDFIIRCVENNGIWSIIYKDVPTKNPNSPTGFKRLKLREKGFVFVPVEEMIKKTKDFIDNYEPNLFKSLEYQKEKHINRYL